MKKNIVIAIVCSIYLLTPNATMNKILTVHDVPNLLNLAMFLIWLYSMITSILEIGVTSQMVQRYIVATKNVANVAFGFVTFIGRAIGAFFKTAFNRTREA